MRGSMRSFSAAWLAGDPAARALGPLDWRDAEARRRHLGQHPARPVAPEILAALAAESAGSPARAESLAALARPGALVVVTGQQVGLCGGPLYALYKALSAVALARALSAEHARPVVPIFWLQTEDHDLAEIDHCEVLSAAGERVRLQIAGDGAPRRSVAHRTLGADVQDVHAALAEAFPGPQAAPMLALLASAYAPGASLAGAFRALFAELLADTGLLFFDPRRPEVAPLAAPVHARALAEHDTLGRALVAHARALAGADLREQVPLRPDASLSFFHPAGAAGDRFRLQRGAGGWMLPGGERVDAAALERALAEAPLGLSTSALLRPILQDTLFPTAVTVGGPGELAYFGQLAPLHEAFSLPRPMFALRARLRVLDDAAVSRLGQLGLAARELEAPREVLLGRLARARPVPEGLPAPGDLSGAWLAELDMRIGEYESRAAAIERGLVDGARRARAAVHRAMERLAARHARALALRDEVTAARVDRLQRLVYPGAPQERVYALPTFACRAGAGAFVGRVAAAIDADPFSTEILEI